MVCWTSDVRGSCATTTKATVQLPLKSRPQRVATSKVLLAATQTVIGRPTAIGQSVTAKVPPIGALMMARLLATHMMLGIGARRTQLSVVVHARPQDAKASLGKAGGAGSRGAAHRRASRRGGRAQVEVEAALTAWWHTGHHIRRAGAVQPPCCTCLTWCCHLGTTWRPPRPR